MEFNSKQRDKKMTWHTMCVKNTQQLFFVEFFVTLFDFGVFTG